MEALPRIDEHSVTVDAPQRAVWEALSRAVERSFSSPRSTAVARALGCRDVEVSGPRPLAVGSTFPGFHVAEATPPTELVLAGGHRFSHYALIFRLDDTTGGVRLRAESRGDFPGAAGKIYRTMVIGTGGHVLAVRHLLTAITRQIPR